MRRQQGRGHQRQRRVFGAANRNDALERHAALDPDLVHRFASTRQLPAGALPPWRLLLLEQRTPLKPAVLALDPTSWAGWLPAAAAPAVVPCVGADFPATPWPAVLRALSARCFSQASSPVPIFARPGLRKCNTTLS